ncbi:trypsin-like serine protease [Endothiovibrio diazotrophicus]
MGGLNAEYSVQIRIRREDGKFKFGSGYGIGPHWVLTARHVLFGEGVDASASIRVSCGDVVEEVSRERIRWDDRDLDIALIRCDTLFGDAPHAGEVLAGNRPTPEEAWSGYGFSGILPGESEGRRELSPMGRVGHYRAEKRRASFSSTTVTLKEDASWKGFSGSPIFVGGRLSAVAIKVNTGESGAGLVGSFVSDALDTAGGAEGRSLRELLGMANPDARNAVWNERRAAVINDLRALPRLYEQLVAAFLDAFGGHQQVGDAVLLADAMFNASSDEVVDCLGDCLNRLLKRRTPAEMEAIERIANVWLCLIAADRDSIPVPGVYAQDRAAPPIKMVAAAPEEVDVEAQAARAEERDVRLRSRGKRLYSPLDITPEHGNGLDERGEGAKRDAAEAAVAKLKPGRAAFPGLIRMQVARHVADSETGLALSDVLTDSDDPLEHEAQGRMIARHLRNAKGELGGSLYVRLPGNGEPGGDAAMVDLHRWCPPLLLFDVAEDTDWRRKGTISMLHKIIYNAQRARIARSDSEDSAE